MSKTSNVLTTYWSYVYIPVIVAYDISAPFLFKTSHISLNPISATDIIKIHFRQHGVQ